MSRTDIRQMTAAGRQLVIELLEQLPHREDDYAVLRGLMAEPESNLFVAARDAGVDLSAGAWKIILLSIAAEGDARASSAFRDIATWRAHLCGMEDGGLLTAAILVLAFLEAAEQGGFDKEDARAFCHNCHTLALSAHETGFPQTAYDLAILGLALGAPPGPETMAVASLALKVARRDESPHRIGVCAVEVARAWAVIGQTSPTDRAAALASWEFAVQRLPDVRQGDRQALVDRLIESTQTATFLEAMRERLNTI